ncbi:uncharacterized protein B0P05DRAFT_635125 [Gilbertella persicaria]|uniref:uncharacterized protein n=1 Tax=Gilbertella persicaria TaxID=101096 RepID=UPI00221F76FA|nr:uncharacterized protein B0P05DRAFT_635125 [Gilbertella persicaria]KAI8087902.1 hypothetical protein B0P05DRAFT_635125 [Gilbertella persicaria]
MLRLLQIIVIVLITASFILQMLSLLGNFNGLRSVYIARIHLNYPSNTGGGLFDGFFGGLENTIPNYFSLALFIICQEINSSETICTPPSFGFRYDSTGVDRTGILQVLQRQFPSSLQSSVAAIQKAVIAFLFCLATFIAQIIVYNYMQNAIRGLMSSSLGRYIDDLVVLSTNKGPAIWLSMVAFICLFIATVLIFFTACCGRRRKRGTEDAYEMDRV